MPSMETMDANAKIFLVRFFLKNKNPTKVVGKIKEANEKEVRAKRTLPNQPT